MRPWVPILLLTLLSVPALSHTLPPHPFGFDGIWHLVRLEVFSTSLAEGNFIPRWAGGSINYTFGHPVFIFIYAVPYYLGSLLHFLGFSLEASIRLLFLSGFLAAGYFMYWWLRCLFQPLPSLLGTLLYQFAPYRFVDIYDRAALAEHLSFVFIPLIGLTTARLVQKPEAKWWALSALSVGGLVLTHYATTMMVLPFFLISWVTLFWKQPARRRVFLLGSAVLLGIGLASYFLLPALAEGKYTHRQSQLESRRQYQHFFVEPTALFSFTGNLDRPSIRAGPVHTLTFLIGIAWLLLRRPTHPLPWIATGLVVLAMLLILPVSKPLYDRLSPLQTLQFPWRWMVAFVTGTSLLTAILAVHAVWRILFTLALIPLFLHSSQFWNANPFWPSRGEVFGHPDAYYRTIPFTTESFEHSPRWALGNMSAFPKTPVDLISGDASIRDYARKIESHTFTVVARKESRILDNTLYFPGWTVTVDGARVPIEYQDINHRGLMSFWVDAGVHDVEVRFLETRLRTVGNFVSSVSISLLGLGLLLWPRFTLQLRGNP